jgi:tRNA(fMet)-specific endonuclease VapC
MIVLDTDHVSELQRTSVPAARLLGRMRAFSDLEVVTTIITVEEQFRGRLATIRHRKTALDEVPAYRELGRLIEFHATWTILPFDQSSALQFEALKKLRIRIGPMDLKIASIVLASGATLLSANLRDFQQVPGLQVEDWLHP